MMEYIMQCLDGSGENFKPINERVHGNEVNQVKVGDDGIILMVDKAFTGPVFDKIYSDAMKQFKRVAPLFFKDGETFFRSAAEKNSV